MQGYREALLSARETDTVISRAYTGKTLRTLRNDYTDHFETHPEELQPFPAQIGRSMADGAMHIGGHEGTTGVDPAKEIYAAGQAVGAVDAIVPAGELVHRIVEEAEACLRRGLDVPRSLPHLTEIT